MAKRTKVTEAKLPERKKTPNLQKGIHYTFVVHVGFDMQYTFTRAEVQRDEDGGPRDFEPTDKALTDLQNEIREYIGGNYPVDEVEVYADSDDLLGIILEIKKTPQGGSITSWSKPSG
jgi:hypothetical protein